MNEPGTDPQNAGRSLENQCAELGRLVNLLFAGLVITSFTLTAYLALQARRATSDLAVRKPQAEQVMKLVQQVDANAAIVVGRLEEFGRTHPDFEKRVLSKYIAPSAAPAKK